jgi:hypothetical protein
MRAIFRVVFRAKQMLCVAPNGTLAPLSSLEAFVVRVLAACFRRNYSQRKMCGKCVHPFPRRKYRNRRRNESDIKEIQMKIATVRKLQSVLLVVVIAATAPTILAQRKAQTKSQQAAQQPAVQQAPQTDPSQMQAAPGVAAAAPSLCGNQPLCYEANDFVATVTQFRASNDPRGYKIIDAMMHFQNKTAQPISLGYVEGSGSAIDDLGNRLTLNTNNGGVRGMGVVAGNNMDPKFTLPAGGGGDARFELYWGSGGKLSGVNYEMELSIREMNRVEGNQWTLGDESLIHYQGLANGQGVAAVSVPAGTVAPSGAMGMASPGVATAPTSTMGTVNNYVSGQPNVVQAGVAQPQAQQVVAYAPAGQPCPAGTAPQTNAAGRVQNAAASAGVQNQAANNAMGTASNAISSFGSLFGKKKNAQQAANQNAGATPCVSTTGVAANPMAAPTTNAVVANPAAPGTVAAPTNVNPLATPRVATAPAVATTATAPRAQNVATRTQVAPGGKAAAIRGVTNTSMKQNVPATAPARAARAVKPAAGTAATTATTTNATTGTTATK